MNDALASVILVDILHVARLRDASDIHLAPDEGPTIRAAGRLESLGGAPLTEKQVSEIAASLVGDTEFRRVLEGEDVSTTWLDDADRVVRVHAFRARGGVSVALRLLDRRPPSLEELGFPTSVARFAQLDRGLVIFAGPTGSGKSTSLAAFIDRINSASARRILTLEDPIEYRHESKRSMIVQREIGTHSRGFESAILGALRSDPDVIVVGEMRDAATIRSVLTAAETGHLVLATLHTGDAVQTIDRIVDAFSGPEQAQVRAQLAQVLSGVVCQRLVKRDRAPGRRLAAEVLLANDPVRALIRESRTHQLRNVILTGRQSGMQTLEHHLSELLASNEIALDEALRIAARPDELRIAERVSAS
ncbi:MAG: PilT/PilU family type 4a pilus ATPase [Candidatus Eremiobacteraeota bacterium]|nr:PilT/PilU family type 4a pilus ATPase [Candidatus Eremiobacteraeota bacterium]